MSAIEHVTHASHLRPSRICRASPYRPSREGGGRISTGLRDSNRGAVAFAVTPIFGGGYHAPERGIASPAAGFHQILTLPNGVKSCSSLRSKSRNPAVFWHRGKQPVVSNDTEPRVPGFLQILQDFSAEGRFLRRRKNSPNDPD